MSQGKWRDHTCRRAGRRRRMGAPVCAAADWREMEAGAAAPWYCVRRQRLWRLWRRLGGGKLALGTPVRDLTCGGGGGQCESHATHTAIGRQADVRKNSAEFRVRRCCGYCRSGVQNVGAGFGGGGICALAAMCVEAMRGREFRRGGRKSSADNFAKKTILGGGNLRPQKAEEFVD